MFSTRRFRSRRLVVVLAVVGLAAGASIASFTAQAEETGREAFDRLVADGYFHDVTSEMLECLQAREVSARDRLLAARDPGGVVHLFPVGDADLNLPAALVVTDPAIDADVALSGCLSALGSTPGSLDATVDDAARLELVAACIDGSGLSPVASVRSATPNSDGGFDFTFEYSADDEEDAEAIDHALLACAEAAQP